MKKIIIYALKGGVGKTTTAINIACALSELDKRILLIDNDISANLSSFFNQNSSPNIANVFMNPNLLNESIHDTKYKNISIISSSLDLESANKQLAKTGKVTILRDCLSKLEPQFDYVIIDNAPNLMPNVINAIFAADDIIIPAEVDIFGIEGLDKFQEQIQNVRTSGENDKIKIAGILITKYISRTKMDCEGEKFIRHQYGHLVFKNMIPQTIKVKESLIQQKPLIWYSRKNPAALSYRKVVKEYMKEGK
ncbi:ParA family protein [Pectinatus frisingensis]|uniref:ParA family protein n=1 Tax=Pectinatus frisingensis TaxID=865 RepID=UPI0018C83279|nr:ParA family protein [Pectinatus frisingensis]